MKQRLAYFSHTTKRTILTTLLLLPLLLSSSCSKVGEGVFGSTPLLVDYVDVHQGTWDAEHSEEIFPIVQLPHSLLRIIPFKESLRSARIKGLPLYTPDIDGRPLFYLIPESAHANQDPSGRLSFDFQEITPYSYHLYLDELQVNVDFSLTSMSGLYDLSSRDYNGSDAHQLSLYIDRRDSTTWEQVADDALTAEGSYGGTTPTRIYLYLQLNTNIEQMTSAISPRDTTYECLTLRLQKPNKRIVAKYGISLISCEQAKRNLTSQIQSFEYAPLVKAARNEWQKSLRKVEVSGGTEVNMRKFYTALYRSHLWPVSISEDGQYYSPIDDSVHSDEGITQYSQDDLSYTYETNYPLLMLYEPDMMHEVIVSYLRAIRDSGGRLLKTLDLGSVIYTEESPLLFLLTDALAKGLLDEDIRQAFEVLRTAIDADPERRSGYKLWCLSQLANSLGYTALAREYSELSDTYVPVAGRLSAQQVASILEHPSDSAPILLPEGQINIDSLFSSSLHSLNVNPDLFAFLFTYNLMGRPHYAQKFVRHTIDYFFGVGSFGYPGPDDYGSLSASLVFAMMGLYPVAPGINGYSIVAPSFNEINIDMGGGRHLTIKAQGASQVNKYISDLTIGGRPHTVYWVKHSQIASGGTISMFLSDTDN